MSVLDSLSYHYIISMYIDVFTVVARKLASNLFIRLAGGSSELTVLSLRKGIKVFVFSLPSVFVVAGLVHLVS